MMSQTVSTLQLVLTLMGISPLLLTTNLGKLSRACLVCGLMWIFWAGKEHVCIFFLSWFTNAFS